MEMWSNNACLGYVIKGLQGMGIREEEIQQAVSAIRGQFDWISVEEAADIYNKSPY